MQGRESSTTLFPKVRRMSIFWHQSQITFQPPSDLKPHTVCERPSGHLPSYTCGGFSLIGKCGSLEQYMIFNLQTVPYKAVV